MKQGKLIVLEGPDASGKKTQSELLVAKLRQRGIKSERISFPDYESPWGQLIRQYLDGRSPTQNPAYASILYAADRNLSKPKIQDLLASQTWVVCDRYVQSNLAHMVSNWTSDTLTPIEFSQWIQNMEYDVLGLPKQDLTILLNVPFELTLDMASKRKIETKQGVDILEDDASHLRRAYDRYQQLAKEGNWPVIDCAPSGELLAKDVIADMLLAALGPLLKDV